MNRFRRRALTLGVLIPTVLIVSMFVALFFAVTTEQGTRSALQQVEQLLPLEIEYGSGTLSGRLYLERLRFETDNMRLDLQRVELELAQGCLWRGALCFSQLSAGSLDITLLSNGAEEQELHSAGGPAAVRQLMVLPLPLETDFLELASLRIRWTGGEWKQGALRASVRLQRSSIEVLSASIVEPKLILQERDSAEEPVSGPRILSAVDLPFILRVDDLQLIEPGWDFYGALYQQDAIAVRGEWQHSALRLDRLEVRSSELGELSLNGEVAFEDNWPLEAAVTIELEERLQYPQFYGGALNVLVGGDLTALALQLSSDGAVDLLAEGAVNVLDRALPFSVTVTAASNRSFALGAVEGIPAALQDVEVEFPLEVSASGTLQAQQFELIGAARGLGYESLRITALGEHQHEQIIITDVSVQDAARRNELHANGEVQLSPELNWSVMIESSGLDLPAISEAVQGRIEGSLELAGTAEGERWQIRLEDVALQGQINNMPATVQGFAGLDSDLRFSSSALEAQLNGAALSVQSSGEDAAPGHLQLRIEDMGRWHASSSGLLDVDAQISPDREHIQLSGRLQAAQWSGLNVALASFSGNYQSGNDHAFSLQSTVRDMAVGDMRFAELQLSASGDAQEQSIAVVSLGDIAGTLNVAGMVQEQEWQGVLLPTHLQTPVGQWFLDEPVPMKASRSQEQLTLDAHCWRHQSAQMCPGIVLLGTSGSGRVRAEGDLEVLAGILPPDLAMTGAVQVQLDARWAPDTAISINGKAQTSAVLFTQQLDEGETATFGWDQADVSLSNSAAGLQLDVGVQRDSRNVLGLALLLPPDRQQAIAGSVTIDQLRLAGLKPFFPALATLAGEFSGAVSLSGTVDKPQGFGDLRLTGGHMALQGNPTQLQSLELNLNVRGTGATIVGSSIVGGGELELFGRVDMTPELRLELELTGQDHNILYPPSTELRVSQSLKLTLKKDLLRLTGNVTVLEGLLEIEQLPQGSVALSPSIVEIDSGGAAIKDRLPFKVRMNVQVDIEDRFKVTANVLQTTLGGNLRVQQRPGQPLQLFGNLDTIGGEFRAYQTRLQIKRGTFNFTGPPANPTVNLRAERRISTGDVTVGVHVQGALEDDLQLDIYSDPSMSQADAMSYLVRGRGVDAGAGYDGTSAALSLASGVLNRSELVAELNRIPGVSNIEFGAGETETDTTATVSGYLGERLYLSYGVGLYEPVNVFTSRFYLRSRLWLEVVSSIENSVDLYYSFDVD